MNISIYTFVVIITVFLLVEKVSYAQDSPSRRIIAAYGHDYKPYAWLESGEMRGLMVDIVNEIFTVRLNIPVEHQGFPWKRAQVMVQEGKADLLFTVLTPERQEYVYNSEVVLLEEPTILFTYAGHPDMAQFEKATSLDQLRSYRFVDYLGAAWLLEGADKLDIYKVSELSNALKFLAIRRADLFSESALLVSYNLKQFGLSIR